MELKLEHATIIKRIMNEVNNLPKDLVCLPGVLVAYAMRAYGRVTIDSGKLTA